MSAARWLTSALLAAILVSPGLAAPAWATPGVGIEAETLASATVDGHDYVTKQITIAPGGSTGWHWHPGRVFGVIRQGTLTHDVADCSVDGIYPSGAPITEGSGPDDVHLGRNLGPDPVVMWVVYINVAGEPLSEDVPNPGCPFE
ncbi:cupin [Mycobacterium antarcticum]|uniref:cupin n=1 Tax=unclassified Mycolicibacterium TaxID=2636767 RepID=UPI0023A6F01F|nr:MULTISPECIES: cupin [unclassified Mycolicibacterium]BDX30264.1 cupin [Mycolicibacterium sp. TUM20985]GLP73724.1 cupin [Mycolicibacterium sp. TUM20983]GLP79400.1 cupin [Mycolicibacterium sp. TUM20984]